MTTPCPLRNCTLSNHCSVFAGQEITCEYLLGLVTGFTLDAGAATLFGVPINYEVIHLAATEYVVFCQTIVNYNQFTIVLPIEIWAWITCVSKGKISQYDASFRRLGQTLDLTIANVGKQIGSTSTTITLAYLADALAKRACDAEQTYCNGTSNQNTNSASCYRFLTQEISFGTAYEVVGYTLLRETLHQHMVLLRPDVHCPHIGPGGGGICVSMTRHASRSLRSRYTRMRHSYPKDDVNQDPTIAAW